MVASTRGSMDVKHSEAPTLKEMEASQWKKPIPKHMLKWGSTRWYKSMRKFKDVI